MKKLYFVILLSLSLHFAFSQELKVKSFVVAEKDLSARTNVRKDLNGNVCALVKVGLTVKGAKFEGYVVGDVKYESGEYWVYMAEGAKRLKVLNDEYTPLEVEFSNYEIDKLKGNTTYSLTLIKPEVAVLPAYENYKGKPVIKELIKNMVFVKGGSFTMGTNGIKGVQLSPMEKPAQEVSVADFYIGRYEVSQKEWKEIMGYNNSYFSGSERPVEKVSWDECQLFVKKLSDLTGIKFRLPTDAEWEYAAKGAKESDSHLYSGSDLLNDVAILYESGVYSKLEITDWNEISPEALDVINLKDENNETCCLDYNIQDQADRLLFDYHIIYEKEKNIFNCKL